MVVEISEEAAGEALWAAAPRASLPRFGRESSPENCGTSRTPYVTPVIVLRAGSTRIPRTRIPPYVEAGWQRRPAIPPGRFDYGQIGP
jgi:hypothetical protein